MSMSEGKKKFISAAVTLAGVICLPQMLISSGKGLDFSNSFLSVLVFLLCFPVIHRSLWNGARSIWSFLMSLVLVTACCLGSRLEALGYVWLTDWHMWAAMPFLLLFFMLLTDGLWGILEDAGSYGKQEQEAAGIKRETLYIFLFFLLVWGIVLLAVYPGFFVYDAQDEFNQVAMRRFTTHHPLLHVVLLGGIVSLGNKIFASYNAGIALYMVFQMLLMAGCFTYILSYFRQNRAPVWLRRAGVLYFAFFPVIQMYVLCSAKDTLYSAGMLLTIVLLLRLFREKAEFFWGPEKNGAAFAGPVFHGSHASQRFLYPAVNDSCNYPLCRKKLPGKSGGDCLYSAASLSACIKRTCVCAACAGAGKPGNAHRADSAAGACIYNQPGGDDRGRKVRASGGTAPGSAGTIYAEAV